MPSPFRPPQAAPPLHEEVEDAQQQVRRQAGAVVDHPDGGDCAAGRRGDGKAAAAGRVLGRVRQQVQQHLGQPQRIAIHDQPLRDLHLDGVPGGFNGRNHRLDGPRHDVGQIDPLAAQLDLAARDPEDVEQVVDQARAALACPSTSQAGRRGW